MKSKYQSKRSCMPTIILLITMVAAPFARAVTDTPLDCPNVIVVNDGYRLTQNTTCDFAWNDNDKVFDLNGFTLKGGPSVVLGSQLTIKNGVLHTNRMDWSFSDNGLLSNLKIKSNGQPRGFFIEAGSNFNVHYSTFKNIPGTVLDFYFGNIGVVKRSVFIGNGTGISIQKSSNVVIERNSFLNNTKGVNLWDEDGAEVNSNLVRRNFFYKNGVGINMLAEEGALFNVTAMRNNQIVENAIYESGLSGIAINVSCFRMDQSQSPLCPAENTKVSGNDLRRNGFKSVTGLVDNNDDGITARATQGFGQQQDPFPQGLIGVTLSKNRAEQNADLGFDVYGVTDGGGQKATANGDPVQCIGVRCDTRKSALSSSNTFTSAKLKRRTPMDIPSVLRQYRHAK